MNEVFNPFLTIGYKSKEYFCDRENEIEIILNKIRNGNNITLISLRRLGKTALIFRIFEEFNKSTHVGIYANIFSCTNLKDFTEVLALSIFKKFPERKGIGKQFFDIIKGLASLLKKEIVCTIETKEKTFYRVYDVFLMRWLNINF